QVSDGKGGKRWRWVPIKPDNHARDCEAMCTLLALMSAILTPDAPEPDPAPAPGIQEIAAKVIERITQQSTGKTPRIDPPLSVPSRTRTYRMRTPEEKAALG
ncbi:MAG: hypothetical protein V4710_08790, partial [Verrucomicrobiota bacterium]